MTLDPLMEGRRESEKTGAAGGGPRAPQRVGDRAATSGGHRGAFVGHLEASPPSNTQRVGRPGAAQNVTPEEGCSGNNSSAARVLFSRWEEIQRSPWT